MISKNEIDKIVLLYSENNEEPKLDVIKSIFNDNADSGLNQIPKIVFSGNPKQLSKEDTLTGTFLRRHLAKV